MSDPRKGPGIGDLIRCACGCNRELREMDERKRPRKFLYRHQSALNGRQPKHRVLAT